MTQGVTGSHSPVGHHAARPLRWLIGSMAVLAIGVALIGLRGANDGFQKEQVIWEGTPATIFRPLGGAMAPVILIAHGFAGSQQLMQPFATTLARSGYTAVTFDFAGHGRNPRPLSGSLTKEDGATRTLIDETARVAARARPLGDGRLAVLGHSMATDIIVRFAQTHPEVQATVAVSMFSPAVTATTPRNLLVIAGDWEGGLKKEALRVAELTSGPVSARPGVTYGDIANGSARRVAFSPHTEHVGVLYSQFSQREALAWIDAAFGRSSTAEPDGRGIDILLLIFGVVLLAFPLSNFLPTITTRLSGAGLPWRQIWFPLFLPPIATPVLLWLFPVHFLPVIVGDYLAMHFAVYGLLTATSMTFVRRNVKDVRQPKASVARLCAAATVAIVLFSLVGFIWPIDVYVTSFVLTGSRFVLFLAMVAGTLCFFLSDEWLTRGESAARAAPFVTKLLFLLSLAGAVALDFQRLFFVLIIIPIVVLFFVVYGIFAGLAYRKTRHPFPAGIANAVAFAWAIAATFPLVAR